VTTSSDVVDSASMPFRPRAGWLRRLFDAACGEPRSRAIRAAAEGLERSGALVFADVPGWPRPPLVRGYVPSVYGVYEDREVVVRVEEQPEDAEESDDVAPESADRRHVAFSAWAATSPQRDYEVVVVKVRRAPE
jgi:hypothetical protein